MTADKDMQYKKNPFAEIYENKEFYQKGQDRRPIALRIVLYVIYFSVGVLFPFYGFLLLAIVYGIHKKDAKYAAFGAIIGLILGFMLQCVPIIHQVFA
jgi:hypothetical protein